MAPTQWDLTKSEGKLEELERVLSGTQKRPILLLTHNNPDPDTIASAAGLSFLFKKKFRVRTVIGYGGVITRAENKAMVHRLRIKMNQLHSLIRAKYYGIALVDAQPWTGNNLYQGHDEPPLIVIDHHSLRKGSLKAEFRDIRPYVGATSTIVTEYIHCAGLTPTRSLANALLYGIKTDTNSLARGASDEDFHAFNYLFPLCNPRVVALIENPPLTQEHFIDLFRGLLAATVYRDVVIADLGKVYSVDIIPQLADLLLGLQGVSWSLVMGRTEQLLVLSLRSTSRTHRAGTVISRLVSRLGSAGGHMGMAAGQIPLDGMSEDKQGELSETLTQKFLKMLDRQGCLAKPLAGDVPDDLK
jgi:nanoRNase/pAp phosphatase (c-di-AMP/oligoRNAs hydrolase)